MPDDSFVYKGADTLRPKGAATEEQKGGDSVSAQRADGVMGLGGLEGDLYSSYYAPQACTVSVRSEKLCSLG